MSLTQAEIDRTIDMPDQVLSKIRHALSDNTWRAYRMQWALFLRWCGHAGRTPIPAEVGTLLSYLQHLSIMPRGVDRKGQERPPGVSVSMMEQFLAAAKRFHGYDEEISWYGSNQKVVDFVRGYRKQRNRDPKTAPKRSAGARKVVLKAFLDVLPDSDRGVRDRAILLLGYYMAARRSELANLTHDSMRWTQGGLEIHIARSKTDQEGQGAWVPIPPNDVHPQYCPVRALGEWVDRCGELGIADGPLFLPVDKYGHVRASSVPLSGTAFETVIARVTEDAYAAAKANGDVQPIPIVDTLPELMRTAWYGGFRAAA